MAIFLFTEWDNDPWIKCLNRLLPDRDIRTSFEIGSATDIEYALVWKPTPGMLARLPNLKVIFSLGAGVDHIFLDPELPDKPVVRVIDEDLTLRMSEYVVLHVLMHHRKQRTYDQFQQQKIWNELPQAAATDMRVGILGLGTLGVDAAQKLDILGFQVSGWSRSEKSFDKIACFHGNEGLKPFLAQTDILVCLLPLTKDTEGILNEDLIRQLASDGPLCAPVVINAGRGGLQNEGDILKCLEDGSLGAATLDVFESEPLPPDSPLWKHPNVTITPHNAATSDAGSICRYIADQISRFESGKLLENIVDPNRGY